MKSLPNILYYTDHSICKHTDHLAGKGRGATWQLPPRLEEGGAPLPNITRILSVETKEHQNYIVFFCSSKIIYFHHEPIYR